MCKIYPEGFMKKIKILLISLSTLLLSSCFYTPEEFERVENRVFSTSIIQNNFNNQTSTTFSITFPNENNPYKEEKVEHCILKTYLVEDIEIDPNNYPDLGDFSVTFDSSRYELKYLDFYETQIIDFIKDGSRLEIQKTISEISEYDSFFVDFPKKIEFKSGYPQKIDISEEGWITELKENYSEFNTELTVFYEENGIEYVKTLSCNYTNSKIIVITPQQREMLPTVNYWGYLTISNQLEFNFDKSGRVFEYKFQNNETIPIEIR